MVWRSFLLPGLVLAATMAAGAPAQAQVPQLLLDLPLYQPDKKKDYTKATDVSVSVYINHQEEKGNLAGLSSKPVIAGLPATFTVRDGQVYLNAISFIHGDISKLKSRDKVFDGPVFSQETLDNLRTEAVKRIPGKGPVMLVCQVNFTYKGSASSNFTIAAQMGTYAEARAILDRWTREDLLVHSDSDSPSAARFSFLGSELRRETKK